MGPDSGPKNGSTKLPKKGTTKQTLRAKEDNLIPEGGSKCCVQRGVAALGVRNRYGHFVAGNGCSVWGEKHLARFTTRYEDLSVDHQWDQKVRSRAIQESTNHKMHINESRPTHSFLQHQELECLESQKLEHSLPPVLQ